MAKISLFQENHRGNSVRIPRRPLGEVSDFVVEQMPARLAAIRAGEEDVKGLVHDAELFIAGLGKTTLEWVLKNESAREVAALDMKMIEAGIVQSDGVPPQDLVAIVDTFADVMGQLPAVTYEDLVLINPPQDRRTFTNGSTGQSEADFYEGHRVIETYMDEILNRFHWAIDLLSEQGKRGIEKANLLLQIALTQLHVVLEYVETIGMDLNREDFALFRSYFQAHPVRQTKGASGAFSATVPAADLLLGGENLTREYLGYLDQNMLYFPRGGREELHRALVMVQEGLTLNSLYQAAGRPEDLGETLQELSHAIRIFRGKHYKAVKYQLPKVIKGEEVGSGRETGEFLHKRIDIRHID